jgi:precorrin-6B methylase 2
MSYSERGMLYKILKLVHWHYVAFKNEQKKPGSGKSLRWQYNNFKYDLSDIISDSYYKRKFGISTLGRFAAKEGESANSDETIYMPTTYNILRDVFKSLPLTKDDVFMDVGCGMGRVVFYAATMKLKRVIGIELRQSMYDVAVDNYAKLKNRENYAPIDIVHGDVTTYNINDVTVFFLFNPFGIQTMTALMNNIKQSLTQNARNIRIVYIQYDTASDCKQYLDSLEWLHSATIKKNISIYSTN